jgi:hypothetical protein
MLQSSNAVLSDGDEAHLNGSGSARHSRRNVADQPLQFAAASGRCFFDGHPITEIGLGFEGT